ncbi:MAG: alkaline phosphatase family protein [Gammaproteobacteria bacterium]|nr:alkaline phosphatase family protein [Gammaproteobacteria bacterium]
MINLLLCLMFPNNASPVLKSFRRHLIFLGCLCLLAPCALAEITSIAFASCIDDEKPNHPIWKALLKVNPEVAIFMGDNVYLDLSRLKTDTLTEEFNANYTKLGEIPQFKALRSSSQILAIWDDNDYGQRDGDGSFEHKEFSKQKFLEFWDIEPRSARAEREGNFDSVWIGQGEQKIQVILSDTRYFRSSWKRDSSATECTAGNIVPSDDEDATILGTAQWSWLEKQLSEPAAMHIFVSGIQVIPEEHCFERWGGFPHERNRLLELLSQTEARSIILSGDRHLAETSRLLPKEEPRINNELIEFTSSSFTSRVGFGASETNNHRVKDDNIRVNNFGLLTLDWQNGNFTVEYLDRSGTILQKFQTVIELSDAEP